MRRHGAGWPADLRAGLFYRVGPLPLLLSGLSSKFRSFVDLEIVRE